MNIEEAEKVTELVNLRNRLYKEYTKTCNTFDINIVEHGENMIKRVRIALLQELQEIDNQIKQIQC